MYNKSKSNIIYYSFQYTYYNKDDGEVYQSIEKLDKRGMELIEKHDTKGFQKYLDETDNTICGRNPILILLNVNIFLIMNIYFYL